MVLSITTAEAVETIEPARPQCAGSVRPGDQEIESLRHSPVLRFPADPSTHRQPAVSQHDQMLCDCLPGDVEHRGQDGCGGGSVLSQELEHSTARRIAERGQNRLNVGDPR